MISFFYLFVTIAYSSHVKQFTETDFYEHTQNSLCLIKLFVQFFFSLITEYYYSFSPDCKHCKKVAPIYEEVADYFDHYNKSITIAEVDCEAEGKLCNLLGIDGYPMFRFYNHSSYAYTVYDGDKSLDSFKAHILTHLGVLYKPQLSRVIQLSERTFHSIVNNQSMNVLVAFVSFSSESYKEFHSQLEFVALSFRDESDIAIAEIDVDKYKQYIHLFNITSLPSARWFPAYNASKLQEEISERAKEKAENERKRKYEIETEKNRLIEQLATLMKAKKERIVRDENNRKEKEAQKETKRTELENQLKSEQESWKQQDLQAEKEH